jgi:uncharacterized membrane protein
MKRARRARSAPVLASDTVRGYLALVVAFATSFAAPWILAWLAVDLVRPVVLPVTLFLSWVATALAATLLQVAVFWRAAAPELVRWMRATEPDGRLRRLLWAVQGGGAISWAITGSAVALVAVVSLRLNAELRENPIAAVAGVAAVAASLAMIVTSFAVRYARQHAVDRGLGFPGGRDPRFGDFLYFSAQVATTFGGSDVEVLSGRMRGLVAVHSIISWVFNTVVVALLVSLFVS